MFFRKKKNVTYNVLNPSLSNCSRFTIISLCIQEMFLTEMGSVGGWTSRHVPDNAAQIQMVPCRLYIYRLLGNYI